MWARELLSVLKRLLYPTWVAIVTAQPRLHSYARGYHEYPQLAYLGSGRSSGAMAVLPFHDASVSSLFVHNCSLR
jgi:hypothetical protein